MSSYYFVNSQGITQKAELRMIMEQTPNKKKKRLLKKPNIKTVNELIVTLKQIEIQPSIRIIGAK